MKIFSNFDTTLPKRLHKEALSVFGHGNALFVRRDSVYLVIRFVPWISLFLFLSAGFLTLSYGAIGVDSNFGYYVSIVVWIIIGLMALILFYYLTGKYIHYKLDFVIITPRQIVMYDQQGLFARTTRSVETDKIKTINVMTQGWLSSIFNFGSMVFLAEGDVENGEITLFFLSNPLKLRNAIYKIIEQHDRFTDDG